MLRNETNINNPLIKFSSNNAFTIKNLNDLPLDDIPKEDRERIMKSWLPPKSLSLNPQRLSYDSTVRDLAVLSLKRKVMRRRKLYEVRLFFEVVATMLTGTREWSSKTCSTLQTL